MRSNNTSTLRFYLQELEQNLPAEAAASVLSQMLVIVKMVRDEPYFQTKLVSIIEEGGYVKDILEATLNSLESRDLRTKDSLIDMGDKGWAAISVEVFYEFIVTYDPKEIDLLPSALMIASVLKIDGRRNIRIPSELTRCMYRLLEEPEDLLLPSASSAAAGLCLSRADRDFWFCSDNEIQGVILSRLFFVCGCDAQRVASEAVIEAPERLPTSILLVPSFGARVSKTDYEKVPVEVQGTGRLSAEELSIAKVIADGQRNVIAIVPTGVLSSGGGSPQFRNWLFEVAGLTSIIEFPERLLGGTAIGCAVLHIKGEGPRTANSGVKLIDATSRDYVSEEGRGRYALTGWEKLVADVSSDNQSEGSIFVSDHDLYANDFVLQPSRYLAKISSGIEKLLTKYPVYPLSAIVEIKIPTPVRPSDSEYQKDADEFREVRISDFQKSGTIENGSKEIWLDRRSIGRVEKQKLRPGDILVGTKGTIGKAAIVTDSAPANLLAGLSTARLRLKTDGPVARPEFIVRYLTLPAVQKYLGAMSSGATIQFIKSKDLAALPVPIPPIEIQEQVADTHRKIQDTLDTIERLDQEWRELSEGAFVKLEDEPLV